MFMSSEMLVKTRSFLSAENDVSVRSSMPCMDESSSPVALSQVGHEEWVGIRVDEVQAVRRYAGSDPVLRSDGSLGVCYAPVSLPLDSIPPP